MRTTLILFFLAALLGTQACKKDEKTWTVTYKVVNFDATPASYRVSFVNELGATELQGPIDDHWWISRELPEIATGTTLEMSFELESGAGNFELFIEVNGSAIASSSVRNPNTPVVLTAVIKDPEKP